MAIDRAAEWLHHHPPLLPALTANQREINRLLENHRHADQVARVATRDPALALELLIRVNSRRGDRSGRDIVESPLAAISLLGDQVCHNMFKDFKVAEQTLTQAHQLFLFEQIINRSLHNEVQAENWAREVGFKTTENIRTAALLAYLGELLCCAHDFERYLAYTLAGASDHVAEHTFGFTFIELTGVLCDTLNLPRKIAESGAAPQENSPATTRLLQFTTLLCRQCEFGWANKQLEQLYEQLADWTHSTIDKVIARTHQHAVEAARTTYAPEAWQPAARLVLIEDQIWGPHLVVDEPVRNQPLEQPETAATSTPTETSTAPVKPATIDMLKRMLAQSETTQSDLINTGLKGIYQEIGMSRVALLLLTRDRKLLKNRMSLGLDAESPFRRYAIELTKSGLFKILLNKPQAIWINRDSIKKYQQLLPSSLMASIMTDNFVAMSLFIGDKPIGVIYSDRSNVDEEIGETQFAQFKQLVSVTSKALTLLAKR